MRAFFRGILLFCFGFFAGGLLMAAAFSVHVVRAGDGWHWTRNRQSHMTSCFADVRDWTAADWSNHPRLAAALIDAGQGDLVIRSAADGAIDEFLNSRVGAARQRHQQ